MGASSEALANSEPEQSDGLRVAMSPTQMAAVVTQETVETGGTLTNRLIGALRLIGCGAELGSAAVLYAAPEPTMLTKAGATILGAHGIDQCVTGGRQVWSGRDVSSFTEQGVSSLARSFGASADAANMAGAVTDFLVPVGGAVLAGAVRAGAIRAGRISLLKHEAGPAASAGGHTIARHVGWSDQQLLQRMAQMTARGRAPKSISTFTDLTTAEKALTKAMRINRGQITAWAKSAPTGNVLRFQADLGDPIGRGVLKSTGQIQAMTRVEMRLMKDVYQGKPYFILTAFPVP